MDTCTSGTQRKGNRAIGPYDYIRGGETSKKVGCSIRSACVEREQPLMNVVTVKFGGGGPKGGGMGTRSVFRMGTR